ncbi:MAG: NAD-dependent epimerase/dehydratase family protein [Gammaproteobacteria bacterium]
MNTAGRTALIVGCGYAGLRFGRQLAAMGVRVVGTTRRSHRPDMQAAGLEVLAGELHDAAVLAAIRQLRPSLVAYFVPPRRGNDPLPTVMGASTHPALDAFLYASSSGVYGDRAGGWVDETTPIGNSDGNSGTGDPLRAAAERVLLEASQHDVPGRVCRITGIYGPGRTLRRLLATGNYALIDGHDVWVGRIHVDDLVSGLVAAWIRGRNGSVYNMVDDRPHRASEFANLSADLNNLPRPTVISEAEARQRYDRAELRLKLASKRVRHMLLKTELGVELKYPSYLTGLPASLVAG